MRICPQCKAIVEDGEKFCSNCGYLVGTEEAPKLINCLKCGAENSSASVYCINCGETLDDAKAADAQNAGTTVQENNAGNVQNSYVAPPAAPQYTAPPVNPAEPVNPAAPAGPAAAPVSNTSIQSVQPAKKSTPDVGAILKDKKKFPIIIAAVAALGALLVIAAIVITIIIVIATSGGSSTVDAIYLKDDELYYPNYSGTEGWEITSNFAGSSDLSTSNLASRASDLTPGKVKITKDKKYIFFPDKLTGSGSYYNIYYRRLNSNDEAHKMDSDVISYRINDNGSTVVYLKDNNNSLYTYSMSKDDREKIGSDVADYTVSADCKTVVYIDRDGTFYFWEKGKEKEKVDSDVVSVSFTDDYLRTMYYIKDDTLYKKSMGQEKVKVSDDVNSLVGVYSSGEAYYTKKTSGSGSESTYYDMLEDDLAEADKNISRPEMPTRPYRSSYKSNSEYQKANDEYLEAYNKYEEDYKKYSQKEARDRIRESLKNDYYYDIPLELYYYNGTEQSISKNVSGSVNCSYETPLVSYSESTSTKVRFSEVYKEGVYASDVRDKITEANSGAKTYCIAAKETVKTLDLQFCSAASFSKNGASLYFTAVTKEEAEDLTSSPEEKTLYKVNISGNNIGEPEAYDKDVSGSYFFTYGDDKIIYFKDIDNSASYTTGTLYANKVKVDDDALTMTQVAENGQFIYYKDYNDDMATVKIFYGDKSEKINDDIYSAQILPDGTVVYLYDYSTKSREGDLYCFKGGKSSKIDTDVSSFALTSERIVDRYISNYR